MYGGAGLDQFGAGLPPLPSFLGAGAGGSSGGLGKAEQDAKWVGDFTDELAVEIALRHWERAVELVQQGVPISFALPLD